MFRLPTLRIEGAVGKIFYIHKKRKSLSSAFEIKENVNVYIQIPTNLAATEVKMHIFSDGDAKAKTLCASWIKRKRDREYYKINILPKLSTGLYFFDISVKALDTDLFAARGENGYLTFIEEPPSQKFQLTVSDFKYKAPKDKYGGVIYQIFVDRFSRGEKILKKKDGIYPEVFDPIPEYPEYPGAPLKNNTFYGGNLSGIIENLDYFQKLGVNMLYLTPIFESVSNHKYDTADYMRIDSGFGGEETLRELIEKASEYGIGIILDGVFNHTGADSVYFNKYGRYKTLGAYNSRKSEYYEWYDFKNYPQSYTSWWDIEILPRINPSVKSCGEFISGEGGVIDKYISLGALGFRLDVVDELDDEFIKSIKHRQNKINEKSVLYGEVWEDASNKIAYGKRKSYYLGDELDGVMNYPLREGIIAFVKHLGCAALKYALLDVYNNAPKRISDFQMNLLGTHDTPRILTVLSDGFSPNRDNGTLRLERMSEAERVIARERLICAYTILATLPGIPHIYYADEAGLEGYSDPFNRLPYPHGKEDKYILENYRKIGKMRTKHSVYKTGDFKLLYIDDDVLVFARYSRAYAYITVASTGECRLNIKFLSNAENILDGSFGMMYNLNKNQTAVYKVRRSDEMYFEKV